MSPEENLKLYEQDTTAEQKIRDAITNAYQNLEPESTLVHTYENEQFPTFYNAMSGYGANTGLTGLDPLTLLQNAWGAQSRMSTAAQVARDAFNIRKAGMEDLIKTGTNQWNMGYQGAQNAYQRWWEQKQHEDEMALAREQMRRSGYGTSSNGADVNDLLTALNEVKKEAYRLQQQDKQEAWNAGANAAWENQKSTKATPKKTSKTTNMSVAPKMSVAPQTTKTLSRVGTLGGYSSQSKTKKKTTSTGSSFLDNLLSRIR